MHRIIQPAHWQAPKGYANGVLSAGAVLHIAGQIGWDKDQVFTATDFIGQMTQALQNIKDVLLEAGGSTEDLTRLTWFVTDKKEYLTNQRAVGEAYRRVIGNHFPAMTMVVVSELVEDEAVVEIEATAVIDIEKST